MTGPIADWIADVNARIAERSAAIQRAWHSLTPEQQQLVRDAAVMGYVLGRELPSDPVPADSAIVTLVIGSCLEPSSQRDFPAIAGLATERKES